MKNKDEELAEILSYFDSGPINQDEAVRLIKELLLPKWISVKDRLPELGEHVIICFIGYISGQKLRKIDYLIQYNNNKPEWKYTSADTEVTHWTILPELPTE